MTEAEALAMLEAAPDAAPAEATPAAPVKESIARGVGQGLSLGFLDEGAAALAASLPFLDREAAQGETWGKRYRAARELYRQLNRQAKEAHPVAFGAGEIGGSVAAGGGAGLAGATALGAASGAGHSEAEDLTGMAEDAAIGGGLALALGGAAKGLGKGAAKLTARGQRIAQEKAESAIDKAIASARGTYGAERQNMSRAVEVLLRAEQTGALTPQQAAQLAALKASPEWEETIRSVAQNYMDDLPGLAGAASGAKSTYQSLAQNRAGDVAKEADRLLGREEAGRLLKERSKRYVWPILIGGVGGSALGPVGALGGGLAGLGMRPTLRAFGRLAANQPSWLVREGAALHGAAGTAEAAIPLARAAQGYGLTGSAPDGGLTEEEARALLDSFPDVE